MDAMALLPRNRRRECSDERPLGPFERWTTDEDGEPIVEFDMAAHLEWLEKWAPHCPDGSPQRVCHALGFRERSLCELELRVGLGGYDHGVCNVIVDERGDEVLVRVLVCCDHDETPKRLLEYMDCPVRVWLERPLGQRAEIDVDRDEELPLYTPSYLNNVPQPGDGYRPANRRRQSRRNDFRKAP